MKKTDYTEIQLEIEKSKNLKDAHFYITKNGSHFQLWSNVDLTRFSG